MFPSLCIMALAIGQPDNAPLEVVEAKPLPALTKKFAQTDGWTGGDGAQSIPLGNNRTLWLFADTWIGKIENGKRVKSRMINNTAAWQSLSKPDEPWRFFWTKADKGPDALLKPEKKDEWYWPGDGGLVDGKLYLFCKVVRRREKGEPGFQFDWFHNDFLQIANPQDEPTVWKIERYRLGDDANQPRLGVACTLEGDHLYAFGLFPEKESKPFNNPLGLARIEKKKLAKMDRNDWEYWCETGWAKQPAKLVVLFRDAPAEFTVTKVRGIPGFVATYTQFGLGGNIAVRHAMRPEGPWSRPLIVYKCPETDKKIFEYGAKAHPELAERDGQLIVTYCRNIGSLAEHVKRPEIYFPQAVEVQLRWKK
jgi:hypothetical protein